MQIINDLIEKTPVEIKDKPEYKALLDFINVNNLKNKDELGSFLAEQINEINNWFKKNDSTGTSAVLMISEKVLKLEKLKFWKKICDEYL